MIQTCRAGTSSDDASWLHVGSRDWRPQVTASIAATSSQWLRGARLCRCGRASRSFLVLNIKAPWPCGRHSRSRVSRHTRVIGHWRHRPLVRRASSHSRPIIQPTCPTRSPGALGVCRGFRACSLDRHGWGWAGSDLSDCRFQRALKPIVPLAAVSSSRVSGQGRGYRDKQSQRAKAGRLFTLRPPALEPRSRGKANPNGT
jgi:hypothetical protein